MADPYAGALPAFGTTPYVGGAAIVVGTPVSRIARALYVGGGGNATITLNDGSSVAFNGLAAGTILPISFTLVSAATATNLVALW